MARKDQAKTKIAVRILQYFIIVVCVIFVVFCLWQGVGSYLRTSPMFKIREVVSQQSLQFIRSHTLDRLIGQSIFDVDLYVVQRRLQIEYPQIDHLRIYRQFPNRIYVDAIRRDPFAVITTKRQAILIDKDGMVLSLTIPANTRLPMIKGLNMEQNAVIGKPLRHSELELATGIIQSVKENPRLESMPVVSLDMTNLSEIQCVLANQMKIILAQDKIQQKIMMFGFLMAQGAVKAETVNYIDLRFKEPIISKKQ